MIKDNRVLVLLIRQFFFYDFFYLNFTSCFNLLLQLGHPLILHALSFDRALTKHWPESRNRPVGFHRTWLQLFVFLNHLFKLQCQGLLFIKFFVDDEHRFYLLTCYHFNLGFKDFAIGAWTLFYYLWSWRWDLCNSSWCLLKSRYLLFGGFLSWRCSNIIIHNRVSRNTIRLYRNFIEFKWSDFRFLIFFLLSFHICFNLPWHLTNHR